jgi:hypothetical protein
MRFSPLETPTRSVRQDNAMSTKTPLILIVAGVLLAASASVAQHSLPNSIEWHTFRQGAFSNAREFGTKVLETEGSFQKYWADVVGGRASDAPKGVDWAKEKLVAINLGVRPNTGYELYVRSVERVRTNEIRFNVVERLPLEGMPAAQVRISPWVLIRMERAPGNITFAKSVQDGNHIGGIEIIPGPPGGSCCSGPCTCCKGCGCGCQRGGGDSGH